MHPISPKPAATNGEGSATARSIVSLLICIHLLCVAVVLASNFRRSPLQTRLVSIFAPYTKVLHFDPSQTPYYYTLGRNIDDDTWLVIDLYPSADLPVGQQKIAETTQLPSGGSNWLENRRRGFQLAKLLADSADPQNENDDVTSEIARAVGGWAIRKSGNGRAVVRCMRKYSQSYDLSLLNAGFPPDRPTDVAYDTTVYEADVWIDEDKQVQVQKRASRAEVAPRQGAGDGVGRPAPNTRSAPNMTPAREATANPSVNP